MARQDERTSRIYKAAQDEGLISKVNPLTELARLLVSDDEEADYLGVVRKVKNWDTRGPSAEGLLQLQERTGINATYVMTGKGPHMVAGWPEGRAEKTAQQAPTGTYYTPRAVLDQLSDMLGTVPQPRRHVIADELKALALAPDSKELVKSIFEGIAATHRRNFHAAADLDNMVMMSAEDHAALSAEWRKQAMRLAEAHHSEKSRALLTDFLAKLDTLMRAEEKASKKPAAPAKSEG